MKKLLLFSCALLALSATAAFAQFGGGPGIDLSWKNCVVQDSDNGEPAPVLNVNLNCNNKTQTNKLVGSFKAPRDMAGFFAMDLDVDLQDQNGPLQPYHHYESGTGCNASGVALSIDNTASGGCGLFDTPWGAAGGGATPFVTAYSPGFGGNPAKARLFLSIARASNDAFHLVPGTNYYCFHLTFNNGQAGAVPTCAGCSDKIAIVWNSATMFSNDGSGPDLIFGPDGKPMGSSGVSACGTVNGASQATCASTPAKNTTWGQIKTLYR